MPENHSLSIDQENRDAMSLVSDAAWTCLFVKSSTQETGLDCHLELWNSVRTEIIKIIFPEPIAVGGYSFFLLTSLKKWPLPRVRQLRSSRFP